MNHLKYALKASVSPLRGSAILICVTALLAFIQFALVENRPIYMTALFAVGYTLLALGLKLLLSATFGLFVDGNRTEGKGRAPLLALAMLMFVAGFLLLFPLFTEAIDMVRQYEALS